MLKERREKTNWTGPAFSKYSYAGMHIILQKAVYAPDYILRIVVHSKVGKSLVLDRAVPCDLFVK
jgi:hypothetical protein